MRFALASFLKDIDRWRRDYLALLIWIAIPLLIGSLITLMMSGGGKPHGVLLLVDEDQTFLSELVAGAYGAGDLGDLITVEKTGLAEGMARMDDGGASALLVIPDGFTAAFLDSEPVTLTLKTNPAQTIVPDMIREVTEILLDAGFYAHELFADEIATIRGMGAAPGDEEFAALSQAIRARFEVMAARLTPPAIDVEIVAPPPTEPAPSMAMLFMPGIVLMAVLFAANGLAGDFWQEREQGTLRRLVSAPARLGPFVAGKAACVAVIVAVVSLATLVPGFAWHGIAWSKLPAALVWLSLTGVALFGVFAALQMLFGSQRNANIISTTLLFPLMMTGGSFFPFEAMPGWMAALGRFSPNGFANERLRTLVAGADAWGIAASDWLVVGAGIAVGLTLCAWRLGSGFARA